jgi:exosortase A-associated hydrolase 2
LISGLQASFVEGRAGRLFALARVPRPDCSAALFVAPFGEEMNKSRHLFSGVAERLAARGIGAVLVDLFGTGDSEGEFLQATWDTWVDDLAVALRWSATLGLRVDRMLGVRLGCALAACAARRHGWTMQRTVFWQAAGSGNRALDQFLRLRVAASLMHKDGKESIAGLRARLKSGESVEVAGYELGANLADQLDRVDLTAELTTHLGGITWFEIVRAADAGLSVPSAKIVAAARDRGLSIEPHTVAGEPFWSSVEIVRNDELVRRTADALEAA